MSHEQRFPPVVTGLVLTVVALSVPVLGLLAFSRASDEPPLASVAADPDAEVVLAAGDLATCDAASDDRVADLLDHERGTFATLGDHAYPDGEDRHFEDCYDPTFGRHLMRTRPTPGNHDYGEDKAAAPYFRYFGAAAGEPGKGYYSYPLGPYWHVIVLNSNCKWVEGGCEVGSPQERWLRAELAEHADRNVLAYWHHARFSTGEHGDSDRTAPFWDALVAAGADLVLVAHDHDYERFAPRDAAGELDPEAGIRQFVVGTGGGELREFASPPAPTTEVRTADDFGLLRVELLRDRYRWRFLPAEGSGFTDAGTQTVNGPAPEAAT